MGRYPWILGIPDPCRLYPRYQQIVAIYIKYVQCGINYKTIKVLHSAKVKGYTKVVNTLFRLQSMPILADLSDPNNMSAILINNMLQEEQVARQRAPLNNKIFAELHYMAHDSKCDNLELGQYAPP
jgi:hypothetical protein